MNQQGNERKKGMDQISKKTERLTIKKRYDKTTSYSRNEPRKQQLSISEQIRLRLYTKLNLMPHFVFHELRYIAWPKIKYQTLIVPASNQDMLHTHPSKQYKIVSDQKPKKKFAVVYSLKQFGSYKSCRDVVVLPDWLVRHID